MSTAVIGGGVIGLTCAYELMRRGEEVTVYDNNVPGSGASAGNAGWVSPFLSLPRAAPGALRDALKSLSSVRGPMRMQPHLTPGYVMWLLQFLRASYSPGYEAKVHNLCALSRYSSERFDALQDQGLNFELHRDGLGIAFKNATHMEHYLSTTAKLMDRVGYEGEIDTYRTGEVQDFEPALSDAVTGVMHLKSERHVRPESFTSALLEALRSGGATVHDYMHVERLRPLRTGRWEVDTEQRGTESFDKVLVTSALGTKRLLEPLGVKIPMEAAKGVSITSRGEGLLPKLPLKLYDDMVASSPFKDGLRLSGTFDVGNRSAEVNKRRMALVVKCGTNYFRDWRPSGDAQEWAGHRPTTVDDLPLLGKVEGLDGLYLATGHGTLGLTLAPATGYLVAREMLEPHEEQLLKPFRLARFSRSIRFGGR